MKKRNLLLTLACSTLLLSSCSKVVATYPNGNENFTNATIELDHNTLDTIYDIIKGTDADAYATTVSDILTSQLAKAVLGQYNIKGLSNGDIEVQLIGYDVDEKGNEVSAQAKQDFINSHPAYNNWKSSSYKLALEESSPSKEDFEKRVNVIKELIKKQIVTSIWTEANATAYKRNNRFYEVLYARNIDEKLYKVTFADGSVEKDGKKIGDVLSEAPDYTKHYLIADNTFNGFSDNEESLIIDGFTNGVLIDSKYDVNSEYGIKNIQKVLHLSCYTDYINQAIMPTIMKNLLVEQYVLQEEYNAIGSNSTRKVNYIQIANNASKDGDRFFKEFVTKDFTGIPSTQTTIDENYTSSKFDIASNAWKGIPSSIKDSGEAFDLAKNTFGEKTNANPSVNASGQAHEGYIQNYKSKVIEYYKNTPYADLVKEYSTLTNDISTNNTTNYDKFTKIDNNSYDPIVGLSIQEDAIKVADYTTYGWQTSETSSLPETIKNKLFSYALVTEWSSAHSDNADKKQYLGTSLYEIGNTNKYLLKNDSFNSAVDSVLWQDSGNYYIIEVEDIISPDTAAIKEENQTKEEKDIIEEKSREFGYTLASGSTYTTNAMIYFLKQCNINYHDQDVYDYFVKTFPRLFE